MISVIDLSEIDWNLAWKCSEQKKNKKSDFVTSVERWSDPERCKKSDRKAKENNWSESWKRICNLDITPDSTVLDIGAGPGNLTIPLSSIVRHVTAIEPAPGMIDCLQENIRALGITNIDVITKTWEDVDIYSELRPVDIVIASYSLGFSDLKEALMKMNAISSNYVYLFWFADMQSPWRQNYGEIWERLFGVPCSEKRKPNIIFNLVYQIGIYANIEVTEEVLVTSFSSIGEAVHDQSSGLKLRTAEQKSVLTDYLYEKLQYKNGQYLLKRRSYQAKIWWKKE